TRPGGDGIVLTVNTRRTCPRLRETGLVNDQCAVGPFTELLHHPATQIVAHAVGVPTSGVQETLGTGRAALARVLGQRPAVLAGQVRQQPAYVQFGAPPRLRAAESWPYTFEQRVQIRGSTTIGPI